ncbi:MAG: hypothetical protein IT515_16305 [Burkholderiales bacterium]|nr:hypothetical protein [Burkholderiales bacterium]
MRGYVVIGALILVLFGYAQREHWSIYGNDAQVAPRGVRTGSGSAISRHK